VSPAGGRPLWNGPTWLWTVGDWAAHEVRTVLHRDRRMALFGSCLATPGELSARLARPARSASLAEFGELAELPGSFLAVIATAAGVTVVTDLAGLHPVFVTSVDDQRWFASSPLPLAALRHGSIGRGAVCTKTLATRLFCPELPGPSVGAGVFRDVARMGGGHALTLTASRATVSRLPLPGPASFADGAEALRVALVGAVERRTANAVVPSVDLSGGLDSSTLAVLAARAGARPVAVTYADQFAENDDDLRCARNIASCVPRLRHAVVHGDAGCLPFSGLDVVPMTDEPSLDMLIAARTRRRLEPAIKAGSDLHLGGDGGDVVLAPDLTYLADLARDGDDRRLRREAIAWARLRQRPGRNMVRAAQRLGRTSWPTAVRRLADQLSRPVGEGYDVPELEQRLAWVRLSTTADWGTHRSRQLVAERLRADDLDGSDLSLGDSIAATWRSVRWHGGLTREFGQVARAAGVAVQTPFLDNQVVRACLAVPPAGRISPGRPKPLLAAAVGDLLPSGLVQRRTKGDYTASEYHGLRANAAVIRELLRRPLLAELDLLAADGPRAALEAAVAGRRAPLAALSSVIATEVWLRRLPELSADYWSDRR
jgi:asparagine synthase (glutamine-hydrolysing)